MLYNTAQQTRFNILINQPCTCKQLKSISFKALMYLKRELVNLHKLKKSVAVLFPIHTFVKVEQAPVFVHLYTYPWLIISISYSRVRNGGQVGMAGGLTINSNIST